MEELRPYFEEDPDEIDEDALDFERPKLVDDFSTCVAVDNLPKVPQAKRDKLLGVVRKIFSQMGQIAEDGLNMPFDEAKGTSYGFAFVNFCSPEEATKAVEVTDGWSLDKAHTLRVIRYSALAEYQAVPDEYEPPQKPEFRPRIDPSSWLADASSRDQLVIRHSTETEILWAETTAPPMLDYGGEREKSSGLHWCDLYVLWSPQGTYLATFHRQGIALWGGPEFEKQGRYAHHDVKLLDFSPDESYMMTCNYAPPDNDKAIIIHDIRSSKILRTFPMLMVNVNVGGTDQKEQRAAMFKWSHDGKYIARMGDGLISIYELPSMKLLDKKSLRAEGVQEFEWSPKENIIAYWAPEIQNTPARVSLVEIPSRKELRQKNLFNVSDCKMHWQSEGDYLCVKVLRHTKSKKSKYNSFELFRVREPLVPVEMLDLKTPVVIAFAWEPQGDKFAVVHGDGPKPDVSFYTMNGGPKKKELFSVVNLEQRSCNQLHWSPAGGHIVLAHMGENSSGMMEFYDVDNNITMASREHYRGNMVQWDPSGRIVASAVCQPIEGAHFKFQVENGYYLWTFQGQKYHDVSTDNFYQLLWRPRPKSLLTVDQKKKVIKNLRKYERQFDKEDKMRERERKRAALEKKMELLNWFKNLMQRRHEEYKATRAQRIELHGGYDSEDDSYYVVETVTKEVVVSVSEDVVN